MSETAVLKQPSRPFRGAAIAGLIIAGGFAAFIGFGANLETQSYNEMHQLYASLGRPECMTDADLETHVQYIVKVEPTSPADARASIERSLRDHVPSEWWTRFALHPEEEPASTAPPTKPCTANG